MFKLLPLILLTAIFTSAQLNFDIGATKPDSYTEAVTVRFSSSVIKDTAHIEISLAMPKDVYLYSDTSHFFKIEPVEMEGVGKFSVYKPDPVSVTNFDGTIVNAFQDGKVIRIKAPIEKSTWSFSGSFRFQACDKTTCFMPVTKSFRATSEHPEIITNVPAGTTAQSGFTGIDIQTNKTEVNFTNNFRQTGKLGGFINAKKFLGFLDSPESHTGIGSFAGKNLFIVIVLTILGGLALNLTPCVLPMIPITVSILGAGAQAQSRSRGFIIGSFYGLGITLTYGVLGLFVVLTGSTFGSLNASPWFNIGITALFVMLGLGMFDLLHIDFTRFRPGLAKSGKKRGGFAFALFMGAISALLAGACVAPAVISVIVYATALYTENNGAGLLLPFMLGLGMALPWPFTGAGLSFLPKPGRWMVWVRNGFGVMILIIALYYGYTAISLFQQQSPVITSSDDTDIPWIVSLEQGLALALKENKPVLIDFWATWCKNCKAMDATTFKDENVKNAMKGYIPVKYQAEHPDAPETKAILNHFGVIGLPTYVTLMPK